LLIYFIEEGLEWQEIKEQLERVRNNVIKLREINEYNEPLFKPEHPKIPDATSSAKRTGEFLNRNRQTPTSIQDIRVRGN
jgi:hypothetical protein